MTTCKPILQEQDLIVFFANFVGLRHEDIYLAQGLGVRRISLKELGRRSASLLRFHSLLESNRCTWIIASLGRLNQTDLIGLALVIATVSENQAYSRTSAISSHQQQLIQAIHIVHPHL
jgi:hypothetical protein